MIWILYHAVGTYIGIIGFGSTVWLIEYYQNLQQEKKKGK